MLTFLKEITIYGLGDFIFKFIGYASFLVYARIFSIEEFGILSLVGTIGGLVGIFQELGLNNSTQRFYFDSEMSVQQRATLVSTTLIILFLWSCILTLFVLMVLYPFYPILQERYEIAWMFIVLTLLSNVPIQILSYSQNLLRIYFSPWRFMLLSFFKNVVSLSFSLVLIVFFKLGLLGFFWGGFLAIILSIPLSLWFIRKDISVHFDKNIAKKVIQFGYPFTFAGLAYWLFGSMDRWLLSELSNNVEVGLYSVANKFASVIFFFNEVFGRAWAPFALKAYADQGDQHRYLYTRIFSYWFYGMTLIGVLMTLFGMEMIHFSTPQSYWNSANPLGILSMGIVLASTTQVTAIGISLEQKTYLFSLGSWITALMNFFFNIFLIPKYGAMGAAITNFISYAILSSFYLYWTQRLHPLPLEKKRLLFSVSTIVTILPLSLYINSFKWSAEIIVVKVIILGFVIGTGVFVFKLFEIKKY